MSTNQTALGTLLSRVVSNGQRLAKANVALLEAEAKATGEQVATVGALALIAAATASLFAVFLLVTIAYAFVALGLPTWAGFGLVALALLIAAIIFGLVAKKQSTQIKQPTLAKEELERTKAALSQLGSGTTA